MKDSNLKKIGYGIFTIVYILISLVVSYLVLIYVGQLFNLSNGYNRYGILLILLLIPLIIYVLLIKILKSIIDKNIENPKKFFIICCLIPTCLFGINYILISMNPTSCSGMDLLTNQWSYVACMLVDELGKYIDVILIIIFLFTISIYIIINRFQNIKKSISSK